MRRFVLATAMMGMAFGAQAADMPDQPVLRGSLSPAGPRVVNWAGFYVGGQVDYNASITKLPSGLNSDMQSTFTPPPAVNYTWQPLVQAHSINTGFGAFAGYNWQWDDVMVGHTHWISSLTPSSSARACIEATSKRQRGWVWVRIATPMVMVLSASCSATAVVATAISADRPSRPTAIRFNRLMASSLP